jgi:hypothetical protein
VDIFKFRNPTDPAKMEQGEIVDGFKSKMWIERYREAGEFTLVASLESGIREKLPLGTFISHVDTQEIMIVEDHQISDNKGELSDVTITGRGFESFLENRITGSNRTFPSRVGYPGFDLPNGYTWDQAVYLLEQHILATYLIDDKDEVPYVQVQNLVTGTDGLYLFRTVQKGDSLYSALVSLLKEDDLGIKVVRPTVSNPNTVLTIHKGVNRSASLVFSFESGEIESADYLWSNKKLKNSALVSGKWVEVRVDDFYKEGYGRRTMYVDASDLDSSNYDDLVTDGDPRYVGLQNMMYQRGLNALAAQKEIALAKAEVNKESSTKSVYRRDYDVGDMIMVAGAYGTARPMRVTEFVEIEDEHGKTAYPTLSIDEAT